MSKKEITGTIKFSDEELNEVDFIQKKYNEKIILLGQLKLEQMKIADGLKNLNDSAKRLDEVETNIKNEFITVQTLEDEFFTKIKNKYGEGELDRQTGLFIPKKSS